MLEYVHFAHRTSSVLQQPRVYTAFVELVSARQYPDHLGRFVRFDAHRATVAVANDLLNTTINNIRVYINNGSDYAEYLSARFTFAIIIITILYALINRKKFLIFIVNKKKNVHDFAACCGTKKL